MATSTLPRWRNPLLLLTFTLLTALGLVGPTRSASAQGFIESFDAPVLGPEWTLAGYSGPFPRSHGYLSPANEYSLTANPGHLRYILQPMTHFDGFLNDYQTTYAYHSCCNHDAGLELQRPFTGDHWTLETKVFFHLPFANGRAFQTRVYFGDGGPGTFYIYVGRGRDVFPYNALQFALIEKYGSSLSEHTVIEVAGPSLDPITTDDSSHLFRIRRDGGVITVEWSDDNGVTWQMAFTHDLGDQLDGFEQRVAITGLSWFVNAGSYADVDYVKVTPESNVLDDFNRADGELGPNWTGFSDGLHYLVSGETGQTWFGGPIYWSAGEAFGASQEAFATLTAVTAAEGLDNGLLLKVQSDPVPANMSHDPDWIKGCILVSYNAADQNVYVATWRPGLEAWNIYESQPLALADGDAFGARVRPNGEIQVLHGELMVATFTLDAADQAFFNTRSGRIGIWFEQALTARFDDFGGGTLVP